MELDVTAEQAIFESAGQAVHVAFLIMAQDAKQDAPLRAALIRAMESIRLSGKQRAWLDELRGAASGNINFAGLDGNEVRAQCAMVTQAVKNRLPLPEMWVLQAKFGQTDFEDVVDDAAAGGALNIALVQAQERLAAARRRLQHAEAEKDGACKGSQRDRYFDARDDVGKAMADLHVAEGDERAIQEAIAQAQACKLLDNGRPYLVSAAPRRRFAFSAERIVAIKGLADYLAPLIPTVPAMAIDCLLGLIFANHKKVDITFRDIAQSFGGSHVKYFRAAVKMKQHLRKLEQMALSRLEEHFMEQGVTRSFAESV